MPSMPFTTAAGGYGKAPSNTFYTGTNINSTSTSTSNFNFNSNSNSNPSSTAQTAEAPSHSPSQHDKGDLMHPGGAELNMEAIQTKVNKCIQKMRQSVLRVVVLMTSRNEIHVCTAEVGWQKH